MFDQVAIPPAVYQEIIAGGTNTPGFLEIQQASWVVVIPCSNQTLLTEIVTEKDIHPGEAEAICLAIELKADAVLLDEAAGRALARLHDLSFVGILGILLKAKKKGLISNVRQLMEKLQAEAGFYIHKTLFQEVLVLADE